jgi:hypothetical protein
MVSQVIMHKVAWTYIETNDVYVHALEDDTQVNEDETECLTLVPTTSSQEVPMAATNAGISLSHLISH